MSTRHHRACPLRNGFGRPAGSPHKHTGIEGSNSCSNAIARVADPVSSAADPASTIRRTTFGSIVFLEGIRSLGMRGPTEGCRLPQGDGLDVVPDDLLHDAAPTELARPRSGPRAHGTPAQRIRGDRRGELHVGSGICVSRQPASLATPNDFASGPIVESHNGEPACHGFDRHVAESLCQAREEKDICRSEMSREVLP